VGFTDGQYYKIVDDANRGQVGPQIERAIQTLDRLDPNKTIKIYNDEWGNWLRPLNPATDPWLQQNTVMDAVSAAESLHIFIAHADRLAMAGLSQGLNVLQSLMLTRNADDALVKTPTFYVFKMFLPHHRANAKSTPNTLNSETISANAKLFPVLSSTATVNDLGQINVSLVNVDLVNTREIGISLTSSYPGYVVRKAEVLTGPAKDSYNDFAEFPTVTIQTLPTENYQLCGKKLKVTVPSKSVVLLTLDKV
jgi:alpha-N-arabinofuranosidase